jgi:hypothetical protein
MQLKELMTALIEARDRIKEIDTKYDEEVGPLKEAKKALEAQIIEVFKERGEFSTRIEGATASLSVKKTAKIFDEQQVVEGLKRKGLVEYIEERVTDIFKDSVLKEQAKMNTMDLIPGIVVQETEYISIRNNDKKDPRKISTNEFTPQTPKEQ